jgi:hypothetical protein
MRTADMPAKPYHGYNPWRQLAARDATGLHSEGPATLPEEELAGRFSSMLWPVQELLDNGLITEVAPGVHLRFTVTTQSRSAAKL